MEAWFSRRWQGSPLWLIVLWPIALLWWIVSTLRRWKARTHPAPPLKVPVVIVGNIQIGGAGKTPLTLYLAEQLTALGWKVGIISRGYGGTMSSPIQAVFQNSNPREVGDEPCLFARRSTLPVFVGSDRRAVAEALLAAHPTCTVILSDDGLQHYALPRTLELAVIDSTRGLGNGWLLPVGPLRETQQRLHSVDALIQNGEGVVLKSITVPHFLMHTAISDAYHAQNPSKRRPLSDFQTGKGLALAAIASPERFQHALAQAGITAAFQAFPDHHFFEKEELDFKGIDWILMTEKDAVKCPNPIDARIWVVPLIAQVSPDLAHFIDRRLREQHGFQTP